MKVFNKLAVIALVVGTSQVFASDNLSASWQLPEQGSLQASAMVSMSVDEMSSVEGGTYYGPLTANQVIMTITGFGIAAPGNVGKVFVKLGDLSEGWGSTDGVFCQAGIAMAGQFMSQSQISAGKVDEKTLGAADVALAFSTGVGIGFLQIGCRQALYAYQNQIRKSQIQAREIVKKKDEKIASTPPSNRRMLIAKFDEQDQWFKWALDSAQRDRDEIERLMKDWKELKPVAEMCSATGLGYYPCAKYYNRKSLLNRMSISNKIDDFKSSLLSVGRAQIERRKWIDLQYPKIGTLVTPTYDIN